MIASIRESIEEHRVVFDTYDALTIYREQNNIRRYKISYEDGTYILIIYKE